MNKYNLIVLCGPAGSGKNYMLNKLMSKYPDDLNLIIPDTTRPPRDSEKDGVDYNFLTADKFFTKKHLEVTEFNNWYYGTPLDTLRQDKVNITILNPMAISQIYKYIDNLNIKIFYIDVPDKIRITRQLNRETFPDVYEICRRFLADKQDFNKLLSTHLPLEKINNLTFIDVTKFFTAVKEIIDEFKVDLDNIG